MSASPFSLGVRVLGAGAAALIAFLGIGFALPGTWAAERSPVLSVPPEALFPLLERPLAWRSWTAWPDSGLVARGPERGAGAALAWDDKALGRGSFEIVEAAAPSRVRYRVEVQGGSLRTEGTLTIEREGAGSRVRWREQGDFGWNPLLAYWALFMEEAQGREMEKALARLSQAARRAEPTPAASPMR